MRAVAPPGADQAQHPPVLIDDDRGDTSRLDGRDDIDEIAAQIQPGSVAAVIVYENRWVLSLVNTWRRDGARFIADGGISASDVVTALDATEPS